MNVFLQLCRRNLLLFFRDKSAVFFSLLSVFIIIGLYALFLGDVVVASVEDVVGEHARFLIDSWIMAGTLAVTGITTTMGAFGILIDDQHRKYSNDFKSSPIKRGQILGAYIFSAWVIGVIVSLLGLLLAEVYIVFAGGRWLGFGSIMSMIGVMLVSVFSANALILLVVSFFKSMRAFSVASTVVGSMIGFITGIYIPVGQLPPGVQTVVKLFPPSYSGSLYRLIMMEKTFELANLPAAAVSEIKSVMGVTYSFGSSVVSPGASILILLVSGAVFFLVALLRFSRKNS